MENKWFFVWVFFCPVVFGHANYSNYIENLTLDAYIIANGDRNKENHVNIGNTKQPKYFLDLLQLHPEVAIIGELGFNAGHSSELFLKAREDTVVYSFNIMTHSYGKIGKEYIDCKYPERHQLVAGNSLYSIPDYSQSNLDMKFDLIFLDGGSTYPIVLNDIRNMRKFAHANTIVVINNLEVDTVNKAWSKCVLDQVIPKGKLMQSKHKKWTECKYIMEK